MERKKTRSSIIRSRIFQALTQVALLLLPLEAQASSWGGQGEVQIEYRRFDDDKNPGTSDFGLAVFSRVEAVYEEGKWKNVFRGYGLIDDKDEERGFVSLEDFYISRRLGVDEEWKLLLGYKIFNWTATEAFHPADVINSRNFDSDLEFFQKKGELTFEIERAFFDGTLNFYLWPKFESPKFPGPKSRLGTTTALDKPVWVDGTDVTSNDKWGLQWGLSLSQVMGDVDFMLHFIRHMDRNQSLLGTTDYTVVTFPVSAVIPNNASAPGVPYFFWANQFGLTATWALEPVLLKVEAAYRDFEAEVDILTARGLRRPEDHTDIALGFEYPYGWPGGSETNMLIEAQGTFGPSRSRIAELNLLQRDVLFGFRHAFNDIMGTELFASVIRDIQRESETLYNISFTRRLSDVWKYKAGLRVYDAPVKESLPVGLELLDDDSYFFLQLTRYF